MTRAQRWRRVAVVAAVAVATLFAVAWWVLPSVVERQARAALTALGLEPVSLRVDRVGLFSATVSAIAIGEGERLAVDRVDVSYSPALLWTGRLSEVFIDGMRWDARWRDGEFDVAPFDRLKIEGGGGMVRLPFDRLRLEHSEVVLRTPAGDMSLAVAATLRESLDAGIVQFTVHVRSEEAALAVVDGAWDIEANQPTSLRLQLADLAIEKDAPIGVILRDMSGLDVTGRLSVRGRLGPDWAASEPLAVVLQEGTVAFGEGTYTVTGVAANTFVTRLWPLATGSSTITIGKATLGDVVVEEGSLHFAVESPTSVRVERAAWRVGQGWFSTSAFVCDPFAPDFRTELQLEHVALERWLYLVSMGKVDGRGRVRGAVAFRVAMNPDLKFAFGEGRIESMYPGTLRVVDLATAESLVDESGVAKAEDLRVAEVVRSRIVEALQEFRFETLLFELTRPGEPGATTGTLMRVTTSGAGARGAQQPIGGLTVNVSGVNDAVNVALRTKLRVDEARTWWMGMLDRLGRRVAEEPRAAEPPGDER